MAQNQQQQPNQPKPGQPGEAGENGTAPNPENPGGVDNQTTAPEKLTGKEVPHGEVAVRLANRIINHFGDRSDVGRLTTAQFHEIAEQEGLMHRVGYDPKKHPYLKSFADSRNLVAGNEVLAYAPAGEAVIAEAGKLSDGRPLKTSAKATAEAKAAAQKATPKK